jgi:hypothetical protein
MAYPVAYHPLPHALAPVALDLRHELARAVARVWEESEERRDTLVSDLYVALDALLPDALLKAYQMGKEAAPPPSDTAHEDALARARATAYGVALDGLGVVFDEDASPLTLLLLVQQETARARELGEAVDALLVAHDAVLADDTDDPATWHAAQIAVARLRELRPPTRGVPSPELAAIAADLLAKVAALDEGKAGGTEGETT